MQGDPRGSENHVVSPQGSASPATRTCLQPSLDRICLGELGRRTGIRRHPPPRGRRQPPSFRSVVSSRSRLAPMVRHGAPRRSVRRPLRTRPSRSHLQSVPHRADSGRRTLDLYRPNDARRVVVRRAGERLCPGLLLLSVSGHRPRDRRSPRSRTGQRCPGRDGVGDRALSGPRRRYVTLHDRELPPLLRRRSCPLAVLSTISQVPSEGKAPERILYFDVGGNPVSVERSWTPERGDIGRLPFAVAGDGVRSARSPRNDRVGSARGGVRLLLGHWRNRQFARERIGCRTSKALWKWPHAAGGRCVLRDRIPTDGIGKQLAVRSARIHRELHRGRRRSRHVSSAASTTHASGHAGAGRQCVARHCLGCITGGVSLGGSIGHCHQPEDASCRRRHSAVRPRCRSRTPLSSERP